MKERRWWKIWDLALVSVVSLACSYLLWLGQAGRQFDPELVELCAKRSFGTNLPYRSDASVLPREYRTDPDVEKMLESLPHAKTYEAIPVPLVFSAWLDFMRPRLAVKSFWLDRESIEMGEFGQYFVGLFRPAALIEKGLTEELPRLADEAEIGWISAVVMVDRGLRFGQLVASVAKLDLPGHAWERLVEIGLKRTDLAEATPLNRETAKLAFASEMARVDSLVEGRQRENLPSLLLRMRVNRTWRALEAMEPTPARPALDLTTVRALRETDPFDQDADPYGLVLDLNANRREVVAALVIMELKRLRDSGLPMPYHTSMLRPELDRLVKAYSTWITIEGDESEMRVILEESGTYRIPRDDQG